MVITEIPLAVESGEQEQVAEVAEVVAEEVAAVEEKRGRGRPKGACNKKKLPAAPPTPRDETPPPTPPAKTKAKARARPPVEKRPKKKAIVYDSSSSEEEAGPAAQPDTQHIASAVLAMLSDQRQAQRAQRRNRYASWFQNM